MVLLLGLGCLVSLGASENRESEESQILDKPDIVLDAATTLQSSPALSKAVVGDVWLVMDLWKGYGFSPRYRASPGKDEGAMHLFDPTGIAADVYSLPETKEDIRYLAYGVVQHSLVPAFTGKAVVQVSVTRQAEGTRLSLRVSIRMDNAFVGFMARLFMPLLQSGVQRRVDSNLTDFSTIAADLSQHPESALSKLDAKEAGALANLLKTGH